MTDQTSPKGQLEVQRRLGRCMLRLQQYEGLLKHLLAHHEIAGPVDSLDAQQAASLEKASGRTLGTLVKALFESYAVPEGFERELLPEQEAPADRISFGLSYRLALPPERLDELRIGLAALVQMRNELVHHFLERFDLASESGCTAALHHLQDCDGRIDRHLAELRGWAEAMDKVRAHMAAFFQSDDFCNLVTKGVVPGAQP